jgi:DNA-binding NarL/FixJ family response regulator
MGRYTLTSIHCDGQRYVVIALSLTPEPQRLTPAERAIAAALIEGASAKHIAQQWGTSQRTVEHQTAALFRKLGVSSRAELVRALTRAVADE